MGSISEGQPARCTAMMALVRSVIIGRIVSAVAFWLCRSTSAKTDTAPRIAQQLAEAMKLRQVTITSSPGPIPNATSANSRASVPLATATA